MEEKDKRLILLLLSSSLSLLGEHANDVRRRTRTFRPGETRRCERILFLHFNFAYAFHRRSQLFTGLKRLFPCDLFVLLSFLRMKNRLLATKKIRNFTISRESFRVLLIKVARNFHGCLFIVRNPFSSVYCCSKWLHHKSHFHSSQTIVIIKLFTLKQTHPMKVNLSVPNKCLSLPWRHTTLTLFSMTLHNFSTPKTRIKMCSEERKTFK